MNSTMHVPSEGAWQLLLSGQEHQLAPQAVLMGTAHGQIFTDNNSAPSWAAIWVQHRVFLAGSPDEAKRTSLHNLLTNEVVPAARARGDHAFGFYYTPPWHAHLAQLLPELPYTVLGRQYYAADSLDRLPTKQPRLPAGLRLAPVDTALLARTELINYARLAEEMCSERPSVEDFLQRSFGVCALDGDTLAGWCLSEYNCRDRCEVGIEVVETYQRRGLGTLLTQALCKEAAHRGFAQVGWHCLAHNVASGATARKSGLRLVQEYPAAVVWLRQG